MAKANPLQEQLLKAGLVKKSKVAEVAREQAKARTAKGGGAGPSEIEREAQRARAEKAPMYDTKCGCDVWKRAPAAWSG